MIASEPVYRRKQLPLSECIRWQPTHDAYHYALALRPTSGNRYLLLVTQRALLTVEEHVRASAAHPALGFLAGELCQCPETGARYLLIDDVVRCSALLPLPSDDAPAPLERLPAIVASALEVANADLARRGTGRSILGWYRSAMGGDSRFSPADEGVHREHFAMPWQAALICDGAPRSAASAFYRIEASESRSYVAPFFELRESRQRHTEGVRFTCIGWESYRASEHVIPLADEERAALLSRSAEAGGSPIGQAFDRFRRWRKRRAISPRAQSHQEAPARPVEESRTEASSRAADPPRREPPAISPGVAARSSSAAVQIDRSAAAERAWTTSEPAPIPSLQPPAAPLPPPAPPPPARAPAAALEAAPSKLRAADAVVRQRELQREALREALLERLRESLREAPVVEAKPSPAPARELPLPEWSAPERAAPAERAPTLRAPAQPAREEPAPRPAPEDPAPAVRAPEDLAPVDVEARGPAEVAFPVIVPPRAYTSREHERRRVFTRVLLGAFALSVVTAIALAASARVRDRRQAEAQGVFVNSANGAADVRQDGGAAALARFDVRADSLERAVAAFREAIQGTAASRSACPAVNLTYSLAEAAFASVSEAVRDSRGRLDAERLRRYQRLTGEMSRAKADFDRARCPAGN